jgi:hypothetical protein
MDSLLNEEQANILSEGVYSGNITPVKPPVWLIDLSANYFMEAVFDGYKTSFLDPRITVGDFKALEAMQKNVYLFSGAKTVRQVKDLQRAVIDPKTGFLRPFEDFRKDAEGIIGLYNNHWLKTERDAAFNSAQAAHNWKDIDANKDLFPYLMYLTKEDGHVRPKHALLNGIVKPVDSPFWDTHRPQIDWACRCGTDQLTEEEAEGKVTKGRLPKDLDDIPNKLFRFNPAKNSKIFDTSHPYFSEVDKYPYLKELFPSTKGFPKPTREGRRVSGTGRKTKYPLPEGAFIDKDLELQTRATMTAEEVKKFDWRPVAWVSELNAGKTKKLKVTFTSKGSYYQHFGTNSTVNINKADSRRIGSKRYSQRVLYHEFGHAAHFQKGSITYVDRIDKLNAIIDKNKKLIRGRKGYEFNQKYIEPLNRVYYEVLYANDSEAIKAVFEKHGFKWSKELEGLNKFDIKDCIGGIMDSWAAISKGRFGWGHKKSYWKTPNFDQMELYAHGSENFFGEGNPVFKAYFRELHDDLKAVVEDDYNEYLKTLKK